MEEYVETAEKSGLIVLKNRKEQPGAVIFRDAEASLVDLGDGVACLEFHAAKNTLGDNIPETINRTIAEVEKNYLGLVIGNQGKNFCVGGNLKSVLAKAEAGAWEEIDQLLRQVQNAYMLIKNSCRPVVAAPFRMTLGGGYEICAHSHRLQAAAETSMGLAEAGVGLLPSAGGCKEMLIRMYEGIPYGAKVDLQPFVAKAFENIVMAKVSASAEEAKQLGYMRSADGITSNPDYLLSDVKAAVLSLSRAGFIPLDSKEIPVVGETGYAALAMVAYNLRMGGYISEYDEHIAKQAAKVLTGGKVPAGTLLTEQQLLDLEREAYLSLIGEPKTQDRIRHILATGKPLRN